jgi:hypothetical protein
MTERKRAQHTQEGWGNAPLTREACIEDAIRRLSVSSVCIVSVVNAEGRPQGLTQKIFYGRLAAAENACGASQ